ncbi:MAG: pyridoxamine 5'-phosphate oxidase family protein [Clostridiales bacterium]|nr:pyridoxamine 5'-phosphate oxidase family protein [Clostridiales bacterium]
MKLDEIKSLLSEHTPGSLATLDENNTPDVRGFEFQCIEDDKVYFFTNTNKKVYKQIKANPNVSFFCMINGSQFRFYGKAVFVQDTATVKRLHAGASDGVKKFYPTSESNGFTVFCIEHGQVAFVQGFGPFKTITF